MAEIFLAIIIFALLITAMAVGVLMGGKPIAGSCGGVGAALGEANYNCDLCGGDPNKCDELSDVDMAYDATANQRSSEQEKI
ncbi:(Na+)-NQR maturation NqrM [Porticoccaceae bacterium]|nr:(Na+)-NQR maturation NqrM [Porticoccaceae bacterium]MDB9805785.1 (Na+)-NQR maturation NqrM [Porticoccaceae bacterium]